MKSHQHRKHQDRTVDWKAVPEDAINLSALRIYVLTIERLSLLMYRTDADLSRPKFTELQKVFGTTIKSLRKLAKDMDKKNKGIAIRCADNDKQCPDGLCHPPDECSD